MQESLNKNFEFLYEKIDKSSTYREELINKIIDLHKTFRNIDNSSRDFIIESKIILEIFLLNYLIDNKYIKDDYQQDLRSLLQVCKENQISIPGDIFYSIKYINEFRNKGSHETKFKLNKFDAEIILLFFA